MKTIMSVTKKKKVNTRHYQRKKKWTEKIKSEQDSKVNYKDIFESSFHEFFICFSFISILGKFFFGELGENISGLHYLFSFILPNQTCSKKVFFLIFSPKFFILLISPPNKLTLNKTYMSGTQILSRNKKLCISHLCERNEFCKK